MMKICSISAASPINFSSPFIHLNPAGFEVSFHPAKTLVLKNSSIFLINSIISASSVNEDAVQMIHLTPCLYYSNH